MPETASKWGQTEPRSRIPPSSQQPALQRETRFHVPSHAHSRLSKATSVPRLGGSTRGCPPPCRGKHDHSLERHLREDKACSQTSSHEPFKWQERRRNQCEPVKESPAFPCHPQCLGQPVPICVIVEDIGVSPTYVSGTIKPNKVLGYIAQEIA